MPFDPNSPFVPAGADGIDDWFVPGQSPGRTAPWSPGTDHFFPDDWFVPGQSPDRIAPWSPGTDHFFPDDWFVPGQSPGRTAPWSPGTDHFFPDDWTYPDNRNAPTPAAAPSSAPPAPSPRPNPFDLGFANPPTPPLDPFAAYWDTIPASRLGAVAWAPPIFPDAFGRFQLTLPAPAPLAVPPYVPTGGLLDGIPKMLAASARANFPSIDAAQRPFAPTPWAQSVLGFGSAPFSGSPYETGSGLGDQYSRRSLSENLAGPAPSPPSQSAGPNGFQLSDASAILPPSLGAIPPATNAAASFADGETSPTSFAPVGSESNPLARFLNALNPISPANAAEDEGGGLPPSLALAVTQGLIDAATAKKLAEQQKILQDAIDARRELFEVAQGRASSRALGVLLEASGVPRPAGYAAHHIAAGADERGEVARGILRKFRIGINDAVNGVFLPANRATQVIAGETIHSTLHTKAYYDAVNDALTMAENREQTIDILRRIGQALQSGDFP